MDELVRTQWARLVDWLREVDAESRADRESGVGDWSVGDLIAHLGYGIAMIGEVEPARQGISPITVGRYVGGYAEAAGAIEGQSRQLRRQLEPGLVDGIDALAAAAWESLASQRATVVVGRRGPLLWTDYLVTRLIELVVHADDLERALDPATGSPVLPEALQAVADALGAAYFEVRGVHPDVTDPREWVRAATGRVTSADPVLPVLR